MTTTIQQLGQQAALLEKEAGGLRTALQLGGKALGLTGRVAGKGARTFKKIEGLANAPFFAAGRGIRGLGRAVNPMKIPAVGRAAEATSSKLRPATDWLKSKTPKMPGAGVSWKPAYVDRLLDGRTVTYMPSNTSQALRLVGTEGARTAFHAPGFLARKGLGFAKKHPVLAAYGAFEGKNLWDRWTAPEEGMAYPGPPKRLRADVSHVNRAARRPDDYSRSLTESAHNVANNIQEAGRVGSGASADTVNDRRDDLMEYLHGSQARQEVGLAARRQGVPMTGPRARAATRNLFTQMQRGRRLPPVYNWPGGSASGYLDGDQRPSVIMNDGSRSGRWRHSEPNWGEKASPNSMELNPLQVLMHETAHTRQSPWLGMTDPVFRQDPEFTQELGPTLGDLVNTGDIYRRVAKKPLQHTVNFPSGKKHDIDWMVQQAKEHGVQSGRVSMDEILATQAGRAWIRDLLRQRAGQ